MSHGRLFSTGTNDQMIFGQEMVSMLSVTLIAVILHWTITSFKKDYSLTASRSMRIPCLISIISFLMMNIVGMIGWNNVFIPITSITCRVIYPFCLLSYNFGKIAMYYLFTYRIQLIFKHTAYQIANKYLNIYRIFCFLIPTIFWCIWIYLSWNDISPHSTDSINNQYRYCFPTKFKDISSSINISEHIAASICITDLIFSGIPLILFIFKYYQVTSLYRKAKIITNINDNGDLYHALNQSLNNNLPGFQLKHIAIIRKSTMLVIIAIISTWCFILGEAYILRQLGFYLPFDGVINSLCIACLFQFGDDFYSVTFAKCECCCLCFGTYCNHCPSHCCGDFIIQYKPINNNNNNNNDNISFTTTSNNDNHQYYAKIHSHNHSDQDILRPPQSKIFKINNNNNNNNKQQYGLTSSWKNTPTQTGTYPTRINIVTPTQRYIASPEQQLFVGPQSITEFIPINLKDDETVTVLHDQSIDDEIKINNQNNNKLQFSHTPDSALTDSTSNNMIIIKPLKPANKTGAIPVINPYKKPSKLSKLTGF